MSNLETALAEIKRGAEEILVEEELIAKLKVTVHREDVDNNSSGSG